LVKRERNTKAIDTRLGMIARNTTGLWLSSRGQGGGLGEEKLGEQCIL